MRQLLFIICIAFGLLAIQKQATGAADRAQHATGKHTGNGFISSLPQPTSFAEHVQVVRVLVSASQRRDHRIFDDCYLPPGLALSYIRPTHTIITNDNFPGPVQQSLLLIFPHHYFW